MPEIQSFIKTNTHVRKIEYSDVASSSISLCPIILIYIYKKTIYQVLVSEDSSQDFRVSD
jgi:hypothetical protein